MKLKTSFFNAAVFKKNVTRFIPLWALYTLAMLLIMLSSLSSTNYIHPVSILQSTINAMAAASLVYALLVAQLLFGDLFKPNLCNALHAMPLTRTAWFCSHLVAGLAFSFLPNLLTSLLLTLYLQNFWYTAFLWLGAVTLQYLFFFGVAVFSMFLTGNRFAAVLIYGIVNFFAVIALWFFDSVYCPLLPGVELSESAFSQLCPCLCMMRQNDFFQTDWFYEKGGKETWGSSTFLELGDSWYYLLICAAVGIALFAVALWLYRRRALEKAGDFIVVDQIRSLFLIVYTLCAGAFVSVLGSIFTSDMTVLFLFIGLVAGFFTGKMLLHRTNKVFQKKSFLQLGIFIFVTLLTVGMAAQDVFGITKYVPATHQISYATVHHPYSKRYYVDVQEPDHLQALVSAHNTILHDTCDNRCKYDHEYFSVIYHLKNGWSVSRAYRFCPDCGANDFLVQLPQK